MGTPYPIKGPKQKSFQAFVSRATNFQQGLWSRVPSGGARIPGTPWAKWSLVRGILSFGDTSTLVKEFSSSYYHRDAGFIANSMVHHYDSLSLVP